jgi:uncharacterized protein (DUF1697 family)
MLWVALLRAINVGGTAKLPMADLRTLCTALGWQEVRTYIQSGNIVFQAEGASTDLETRLEEAVEEKFGFARPVIIRSMVQWQTYAAGSPFRQVQEDEPNRLMLCLAKGVMLPDAADRLRERATAGEQISQKGDALWIHYPDGAGNSKLTPALFDRAAGSPVTARNWRTVTRLQGMLAGS